MMITLDPDTGEKEPAILKKVAQAHAGMAGVYGAVLVEGMIAQRRSGRNVRLKRFQNLERPEGRPSPTLGSMHIDGARPPSARKGSDSIR